MAKIILLIDDDKKFLFGLEAVLKRAGYQIYSACNGKEGLTAVQMIKPDMIICDMMMPPPNGLQLKQELTRDPQAGNIPFIFVTARSALADKLAGFENGADDYITKPFNVDELLARIQSILRRNELGRLSDVQKMQDALETLRTTISTNISHELRTPLTVLLSSLDLVVRSKFTDTNEDLNLYIERATSSAFRISFLVQDLEMLYAIDQGKINTFRQTIDHQFHIKAPIDLAVKSWRKKNLNLQVNIDPESIIYSPRYEFAHVIAHLVDNSCKFSSVNGEISVSIKQGGLGGCVIEVRDQGIGIPVDLREKVFERYFQISQGDRREYGGLGVGLFIARAFAKAMGGDIQILDSQVGCRVRMIIPTYELD